MTTERGASTVPITTPSMDGGLTTLRAQSSVSRTSSGVCTLWVGGATVAMGEAAEWDDPDKPEPQP
jgi:hypothetical protein